MGERRGILRKGLRGPVGVARPEVAPAENKSPVAGRPWVGVGKVTRPAMTVYSPEGKNTGAAVVVFPGGGYQILAIDLEGTEVCDWLTSRGITCVLLKYRVPGEGLVLAGGSPAELLQALEEWRPIHVEKWLSRETR